MSSPHVPTALTIAGSDSGGGAGIQADLRTFAAFGVHGTSAITALTAQNTRGVDAIHTAPTAFLRAQIEAVLGDFRVGAAKLGMLATLVTPNIPEAEALLGHRIASRDAMPGAARALRDAGARAVLLKGGHLRGSEVSDLLLTADGEHWFHQRRRRGEFHGTGCSLSAAVAAGLALGRPLEDAVEAAIHFVQQAIVAGYRPGKGALLVLDHLAAAP